MRRSITLFAVVILSSYMAMPARAQSETPYIIRATKPISGELRERLDAWLAVDPPSNARYYIVTYTQERGNETLVSLAGVDLETPESPWKLEDDTTTWVGTVVVAANGDVSPFQLARASRGLGGLLSLSLSPHLSAGGGSYVAFPWEAGKSVVYGPRGVHGSGDYGTSGMIAVDLVSGPDMGPGAASDGVYASDAGIVDYVCDDGLTVAVRTYNETTDDYFIYAHMLDNANLALESEFSKGQLLGTLKHGSFNDDCGWASQSADHWHLHWMFVPASGSFRAESCRLTVSTQKWDCNGTTVGTGGILTGGGGVGTSGSSSGSGSDDPTSNLPNSMWSMLINGVIGIMNRLLTSVMPEGGGAGDVFYVLTTSIIMTFKLVRVLTFQSVNIYPIIFAIGFIIGVKLFFAVLYLILFLLRLWRQLVPVIG